VFFKFTSGVRPRQPVQTEFLQLGSRTVPLLVVRNPRARRYLLRLQPDGAARVTIPRGGNRSDAQSFLERNRGWLERQLERLRAQPRLPAAWPAGAEIFFRGELVRLEAGEGGQLRVGPESLALKGMAADGDFRPAVELHFRSLATRELAARVAELAAQHQFTVQRVSVRNQRSRWGSCSRRGVISLNWRLIQTPPFVRDYIILHELAHLRQMNHSDRFWQEVERLCPGYRTAEQWLKANRQLLR
jgi:hypothetical protein